MNYYGYELVRESDLYHYGVPGMRWGVRQNPQKVYLKALNKANKLQKRAFILQEKASNAQEKARKSRYGITDIGRTVWKNRQIKSGKALRKADKASRKAEKWVGKMNRIFTDFPLSAIK